MKKLSKYPFGLFLTGLFSVLIFVAVSQSKHIKTGGVPSLANTCLITNNMKQLVEFYEPILSTRASRPSEVYAEFSTLGGGVLSIFSQEAQKKYIPGSIEGLKNGSMILEFKVANVDKEYRRMQNLVKIWVKPPTTQPWGTKSIYFRDPDGNLVDFYSVVKAR